MKLLLLREQCGSTNFFFKFKLHQTTKQTHQKQVMEEIQKEKELAGQEERMEKKEPRKLFMRWIRSFTHI